MQLYELSYREDIRLNIVDIEDYNVVGTFKHDSVCDTEYYGYRETTFVVQSAEVKTSTGWWPMHEDEVRHIAVSDDSVLTLLVQNAIDDKQGEI